MFILLIPSKIAKRFLKIQRPIPLVLILSLSFLVMLSCCSKSDSPEDMIRKIIKRAEAAAEERDVGVFKEIISVNYTDKAKHDKKAILGILMYYFLRNRSIHLFTRITDVEFPHPEKAEVTMFVAMAGRPITHAEELLLIRADFHRFDITFADEGNNDWKVIRAGWRRAERDDFI